MNCPSAHWYLVNPRAQSVVTPASDVTLLSAPDAPRAAAPASVQSPPCPRWLIPMRRWSSGQVSFRAPLSQSAAARSERFASACVAFSIDQLRTGSTTPCRPDAEASARQEAPRQSSVSRTLRRVPSAA